MAITFQRVPTVAPGDLVTSAQYAKLAKALKDRFRSGLGDPSWRLFYYIYGMFRQIRNPDESGFLFPSQAEFFEFFQMLDPEVANWPVSDAGMPEGANLANPLMAWVFGAEAIDLAAESERIAPMDNGDPATNAEGWELAGTQRGAFDPDTGAMASPALSVASEGFKIAPGRNSPHLSAYGGFLPTPERSTEFGPGDCGDGTEDQAPTPNELLFFTNTVTSAVQSYDGTCPGQPTHVAAVFEMPLYYWVILNNGHQDFLPYSQWVKGPFHSGAALQKEPSRALERVQNRYIGEFRGTDAQRGPELSLAHAFDTEAFLRGHYRLAPAYGQLVGEAVVAEYPLFRFSAPGEAPYILAANASASMLNNGDATQYAIHSGFVFLGCRVTASGVSGGATIGIYDGSTLLQAAAVADGSDLILWMAAPTRNLELRILLATACTFTGATGNIEIECLETLDMHPGIPDLFLLLRLGSAHDTGAVDGRGIDFERAREIGETYQAYGCAAAGFLPLATAEVNGNGFFDTARRMSQNLRCMPRKNFIGYAVIEGKSVCWFKRMALGMDGETPIDLFAGIAPARLPVASGAIVWGRTYVVRTGTATYAAVEYEADDTFIGLQNQPEFTGEAEVYEAEGIRAVAEPQGVTNEWLMDVELKVLQDSETGTFKEDSYTNYFALSNRCLFGSNELDPSHPDLLTHWNYGAKLTLHPEAPSGYNYTHGINNYSAGSPEEKAAFKFSCPIYQPSPEIESATASIEGGIEVVKLVFKGRFQNTYGMDDGAPASIARDDLESIESAALPRTMENALRECLRFQQLDDPTEVRMGDSAFYSPIRIFNDNVQGACFPHFLFTRLIPSPYEDDNTTLEDHDSPCLHDPFSWIELCLAAICGGYVDSLTSESFGCDCQSDPSKQCALFDYSLENLCMDAFGDRWFHTVPQPEGTNIQGFGPLPNTYLYAQIYNELGAAVNLLNRVRIMLPFGFQFRTATYEGNTAVAAAQGTTCSTNSAAADYYEGTAPNPSTQTDAGEWVDGGGATAHFSAQITNGVCASGQWNLHAEKTVTEWRYSPLSADVENAIPEAWRDMVANNMGTLVKYTVTTAVTSKRKTATLEEGSGCCFAYQEPCPGYYGTLDDQYWIFEASSVDQISCQMETSGTLTPAALGNHVFTIGRATGDPGAPCFSGANNSISVEPIDTESVFLEVPLVD